MNPQSPGYLWAVLADVDQDESALSDKLWSMRQSDIIQFYNGFLEASTELQCPPYTDHLVGASEDTIADIAEYVVSKGEAFYSEVLRHPKSMPTTAPSDAISIKGTALTVYWDRFGESIPQDQSYSE